MNAFDHENLDVYKAAIDFVALIDEIVENLPRGRGYLADQLQRAATSVPLNIAEGAGEFSGNGKARFAASRTLGDGVRGDPPRVPPGRSCRGAAVRRESRTIGPNCIMLIQLARRAGEPGTGTGTGT
jgi:hypothetical protein